MRIILNPPANLFIPGGVNKALIGLACQALLRDYSKAHLKFHFWIINIQGKVAQMQFIRSDLFSFLINHQISIT
jgi:hypothetical protein